MGGTRVLLHYGMISAQRVGITSSVYEGAFERLRGLLIDILVLQIVHLYDEALYILLEHQQMLQRVHEPFFGIEAIAY